MERPANMVKKVTTSQPQIMTTGPPDVKPVPYRTIYRGRTRRSARVRLISRAVRTWRPAEHSGLRLF